MNNRKIAKILYSMSLGLDYADGIEFAEQEIDCIAKELKNVGGSLRNVIEIIACANEDQENIYKKYAPGNNHTTNEKTAIPYYLQCFDRYLYITVDSENVDRTRQILDKAYDEWIESDDSECLEEYLVSAITDAGIGCTYEYDGVDEDEEYDN